MPAVGMTRFELAFRRALFLLILLTVYLTFGTVLFWVLFHGGGAPAAANSPLVRAQLARQERLDFERTELLNVLWAESISRTEQDWSLLANQKLDAYEKSLALANSGGGGGGTAAVLPMETRTFSYAFRHAFLVITTIGGVDGLALSGAAKLLTILYALLGIPLVCLYLDQCVNAVAALLPGSESARSLNRAHFVAAALTIVGVTVTLDLAEFNDEDTPFLDVIFGVFLTASTIGEDTPRGGGGGSSSSSGAIASFIFYSSATILIATLRVALHSIQRRVERLIGGYEFEFTQKVGQLERALSGDRLDQVSEEDEEVGEYREDDSEIVNPDTIPRINVNYGNDASLTPSTSILVKRLSGGQRRQSDGERVHFNLSSDVQEEENEDNHGDHGDEPTATATFQLTDEAESD